MFDHYKLEQKVTSTPNEDVFIKQGSDQSRQVYDAFAREVSKEVAFYKIHKEIEKGLKEEGEDQNEQDSKQVEKKNNAQTHLNLVGYMMAKMILSSDNLTEFMLQNMLGKLEGEDDDSGMDDESMLVFKD